MTYMFFDMIAQYFTSSKYSSKYSSKVNIPLLISNVYVCIYFGTNQTDRLHGAFSLIFPGCGYWPSECHDLCPNRQPCCCYASSPLGAAVRLPFVFFSTMQQRPPPGVDSCSSSEVVQICPPRTRLVFRVTVPSAQGWRICFASGRHGSERPRGSERATPLCGRWHWPTECWSTRENAKMTVDFEECIKDSPRFRWGASRRLTPSFTHDPFPPVPLLLLLCLLAENDAAHAQFMVASTG